MSHIIVDMSFNELLRPILLQTCLLLKRLVPYYSRHFFYCSGSSHIIADMSVTEVFRPILLHTWLLLKCSVLCYCRHVFYWSIAFHIIARHVIYWSVVYYTIVDIFFAELLRPILLQRCLLLKWYVPYYCRNVF